MGRYGKHTRDRLKRLREPVTPARYDALGAAGVATVGHAPQPHYHAFYADSCGQRSEMIAPSIELAAMYLSSRYSLPPSVFREICLYHRASLTRRGGGSAVVSVMACVGDCYESKQGRP